tara:strand:- start:882 stop:1043 length:162 start_codon:yes stop_codon:yes gene_type:complete
MQHFKNGVILTHLNETKFTTMEEKRTNALEMAKEKNEESQAPKKEVKITSSKN